MSRVPNIRDPSIVLTSLPTTFRPRHGEEWRPYMPFSSNGSHTTKHEICQTNGKERSAPLTKDPSVVDDGFKPGPVSTARQAVWRVVQACVRKRLKQTRTRLCVVRACACTDLYKKSFGTCCISHEIRFKFS